MGIQLEFSIFSNIDASVLKRLLRKREELLWPLLSIESDFPVFHIKKDKENC